MRAQDRSVPEPVAVKVNFLSEPGESTSLVAQVATVETTETTEKKEGRSLKSMGLAAGAGVAGFGSVFILRKGGSKKKVVTPQQWAEKKQEEWKVRIANNSRVYLLAPLLQPHRITCSPLFRLGVPRSWQIIGLVPSLSARRFGAYYRLPPIPFPDHATANCPARIGWHSAAPSVETPAAESQIRGLGRQCQAVGHTNGRHSIASSVEAPAAESQTRGPGSQC